jgi:hypothetical protein
MSTPRPTTTPPFHGSLPDPFAARRSSATVPTVSSEPDAKPIDLKRWIRADLDALRDRLMRSVIEQVPAAEWGAPVDGGGSSISHVLLHMMRHHDLAVNTAIRNRPPLFAAHAAALGCEGRADAAVSERDDLALSAQLAPDPLVAYANDVFDTTTQWLASTGSMMLDTIPSTSRRLSQHAQLDVDSFGWLHRMWDRQPVWWLLQWPVLGHGHAHTGELISLRNRLGHGSF